jgi:hypothetical protein
MPLTKLTFQPGLDTLDTETGAEGRWVDCDKIRFRQGLPQKIGGWTKYSDSYYVGVGRALLNWYDLAGARYTSLGTDRKIYVTQEGTNADITPIRQTNSAISCFSTVISNANVTVIQTNHNALDGDFITISNVSVANVGGISNVSLTGEFEIQSITNVDAYVILTNTAATSTVTANGNATIQYQLNIGPSIQTFGYGWSAGPWNGAQGWNQPAITSTVEIDLRNWSVNNWGEDLIITQLNGSTYLWDTSAGFTNNRATIIANAPTTSTLSVIATDARILVCFGTETTIGTPSTQDKLFIRWSDQENYNEWTPNVINTAGSQRISGGSEIRSAKPAKGTILVWTDTAMHSMAYIGPPFIYGFRQLGNDCGAVSLNATIIVNDIAYWMSNGTFFRYAGTVQEVPCSVINHVFDNINQVQYSQVYCGSNAFYAEVTWYYCSANSNQIDRYVVFNYEENSWYFGTIERSIYQDNAVTEFPIGGTYFPNSTANTISTINGLTSGRTLLYNIEDGVNADGSAIVSYIESGDGDIADGEEFSFIDKIIPDFKSQVGNAVITLRTRDYPNDTKYESTNVVANSTTRYSSVRARGRQVAIRVQTNDLGDYWRFGTLRVNVNADGKR